MASLYDRLISEATGVTDPGTLRKIEDVMRHAIFHSTLDWVPRRRFMRAAREAHEVVQLAARENIEI